MPHVEVLDMVERAIGIYKRDYLGAWIRTFSPFHWLNELIAFVAGIPFNLLVSAGVNRSKVESNTLARLVKGTFFFLGALITYIGGVLAIADKLGYLGQVKAYSRGICHMLRERRPGWKEQASTPCSSRRLRKGGQV
jgi:hypothetical protein